MYDGASKVKLPNNGTHTLSDADQDGIFDNCVYGLKSAKTQIVFTYLDANDKEVGTIVYDVDMTAPASSSED